MRGASAGAYIYRLLYMIEYLLSPKTPNQFSPRKQERPLHNTELGFTIPYCNFLPSNGGARVREEDEGMTVLSLKSVIDHHMANLLPTASHRLISRGEEMSNHRSILDYSLRHGLLLEENSGILYHPESPIEHRLEYSQDPEGHYIAEASKILTPPYLAGPENEKSGEKEKSSGMGSFSSSNAHELESIRVMEPFGPVGDHLLRSKGYSVFANLIDGQLRPPARITVFAPKDRAIRDGKVNNLSTIFKTHVVPQRWSWEELTQLVNGGQLETFHASLIDMDELISGDLVSEPNMFQNDCLVVHGIKSLLPSPKKQLQEMDLFEDATATAGASDPQR